MGTLTGAPAPAGPPMAEKDDPPNGAPAPAGPHGPGPQPCRPVPRVHAFGKGGQALRRDPRTPPAMRGWLHKQDSSGLRLWKRRWFVLVDLCLYYYRDSSEQRVRGGLPLPGYVIRVLPPAPRAPRAPQFLFTAEHPGMRTYCLGAETPEELHAWVCALRRGASPLPGSPHSLSLQTPQGPPSAGPSSLPLPTHHPDWCSPCPRGNGLGGHPVPPPRRPPVPPLPSGEVPPAQEEPPALGGPGAALGGPLGPPDPNPDPAGRSPPKPRPSGAERDAASNQRARSDGAANEASPRRRAWPEGRGRGREGVAGRPIRITVLQASF